MPALVDYLLMAESEDKKVILKKQWTDAVELRAILCGCGQSRALEVAYRCLYCGQWFCVPCAEAHFGMTVRAWRENKRVARRTAAGNLPLHEVCSGDDIGFL